jgi:hypothetical protein
MRPCFIGLFLVVVVDSGAGHLFNILTLYGPASGFVNAPYLLQALLLPTMPCGIAHFLRNKLYFSWHCYGGWFIACCKETG